MKSTSASAKGNLLKIGLLANALEGYEFSVFVYMSSMIGRLFFEADTSIGELLRVFTLFACSYLVRPLGSVFFGLLGDKKGRGYSLKLSLILMAVPTIFIGLLPTYSKIGISATIMLIVLRLIQGFAIGGELASTACYVYEMAPPDSKSLLCATVGAAPKIGLMFGSLANYLLTKLLDQKALLDWGWRIPFWLGAPLTLIIWYIRQSIQETDDFNNSSTHSNVQLVDWYNLKEPIIKGIALSIFLNVGFTILIIWMPLYLHCFLGIPEQITSLLNTISLCIMVPLCLGFGYLAQYTGYRPLYIGSLIGSIVLNLPIFYGLHTYTDFTHLLGLHIVLTILASVGQSIFTEMVGDLFPSVSRSLGFSLILGLPAAVVGGTVSLICTEVIYKTGWVLFPAYYTMATACLALPAAFQLKQTGNWLQHQHKLVK